MPRAQRVRASTLSSGLPQRRTAALLRGRRFLSVRGRAAVSCQPRVAAQSALGVHCLGDGTKAAEQT
ncbi:hypothetical protein ACFPRL_26065 [Pseudoclavibacter helvolus]